MTYELWKPTVKALEVESNKTNQKAQLEDKISSEPKSRTKGTATTIVASAGAGLALGLLLEYAEPQSLGAYLGLGGGAGVVATLGIGNYQAMRKKRNIIDVWKSIPLNALIGQGSILTGAYIAKTIKICQSGAEYFM